MNIKQKLKQAKLYCVTPEFDVETYIQKVEQVCRAGADIVQLRSKTLSTRALLETAQKLNIICRAHDVIFIVNDRLDVALISGAHGVHLGQQDLPIAQARALVQSAGAAQDFLIGLSTHSPDQAQKAQAEGADYLGCGPVFATPTKPDYKVVGLELVEYYSKNISIPFTAIGGINLQNLHQVSQAGASCVAVLREAFNVPDSFSTVQQLKQKLG